MAWYDDKKVKNINKEAYIDTLRVYRKKIKKSYKKYEKKYALFLPKAAGVSGIQYSAPFNKVKKEIHKSKAETLQVVLQYPTSDFIGKITLENTWMTQTDSPIYERWRKDAATLIIKTYTDLGDKLGIGAGKKLLKLLSQPSRLSMMPCLYVDTVAPTGASVRSVYLRFIFHMFPEDWKEVKKYTERPQSEDKKKQNLTKATQDYNAYNFIGENRDSSLNNIIQALEEASRKNANLEKKYNLNFGALSQEVKSFYIDLYNPWYDNKRKLLWYEWGQKTNQEAQALNYINDQIDNPREIISVDFTFPTPGETDITQITGLLKPENPAQELLDKKKAATKAIAPKPLPTPPPPKTEAAKGNFAPQTLQYFNTGKYPTYPSLRKGRVLGGTYTSKNFSFKSPFDLIIYFHGNNGRPSHHLKAAKKILGGNNTNAIMLAVDPINGGKARSQPKYWSSVPGNMVEMFLKDVASITGESYSNLYANARLHLYGWSGGGGAVSIYANKMPANDVAKTVHIQFNDGIYNTRTGKGSWKGNVSKIIEKFGASKVALMSGKDKSTTRPMVALKKKHPEVYHFKSKKGHHWFKTKINLNKLAGSEGAPPTPSAPSTPAAMPKKPYSWKDEQSLLLGGGYINEQYSDELKYLIYKAEEVKTYYSEKKSSLDIHQFVESFIRPLPERNPKTGEATRVFNDGSIKYKDPSQIQMELLTPAQRAELFAKVKDEYDQVGDSVFMEIIRYSHQLKTPEEIFARVLYSIPLDSIIITAVTCLLKFLPDFDIRAKVCETILRNIGSKELMNILNYLESGNEPAAGMIIKKVREAISPGVDIATTTLEATLSYGAEGDPAGVAQLREKAKETLMNAWQNSLSDREMLCIAIFAAIPAAIEMLKKIDPKEIYKYFEDYVNNEIVNPAKKFIKGIKETIEKYRNLAFTVDWANLIRQAILDFINHMIVLLIRKILTMIAKLCEGSSEADFANLGNDSSAADNQDFPMVSPFEPANIDNAIRDETVYDDLENFVEGVSLSLIKLFLKELANVLTISELCALLDQENATEINRRALLNKIWDGLLSLDKFGPLRKAFKNKARLAEFFVILGKKCSKKYCIEKVENLEKTKKVLSDLCEPPSNNALTANLKEALSDEALEDFFNDRQDMLDDLLDAIYKLENPIEAPPIFCGPGNELNDSPPIFDSQHHPSEEYLSAVINEKIFGAITTLFEKDIGFYKPIFTTGARDLTQFADIANFAIGGSMKKIYDPDVEWKHKPNNFNEDINADQLNHIQQEWNKYAAPKVYHTLIQNGWAIDVDSQVGTLKDQANGFVSIGTYNSIDAGDMLQLDFNYNSTATKGIPGKTSRMTVGLEGDPVRLESPLNNPQFDPRTFISKTDNLSPLYNSYQHLINVGMTAGNEFYSLLIKQIVTELGEYTSTQELFLRENFDKINFNSNLEEEDSMLGLFSDPFAESVDSNAIMIQCKVDPYEGITAGEIAQINGYLEILIRIITIQEYLRALMVFSAFGVEALLPVINPDDGTISEDSFYYQYIVEQVFHKVVGIRILIDKYSKLIYATAHDKKEDEVTLDEVLSGMIKDSLVYVRRAFNRKLDEAGIQSPRITDLGEELADDPGIDSYTQILRNMSYELPLAPPRVDASADPSRVAIPITENLYSNNERLRNGGFFIEEGVVVKRVQPYTDGFATKDAFTIMDYNRLYFSLMKPAVAETLAYWYKNQDSNFHHSAGGLGINFPLWSQELLNEQDAKTVYKQMLYSPEVYKDALIDKAQAEGYDPQGIATLAAAITEAQEMDDQLRYFHDDMKGFINANPPPKQLSTQKMWGAFLFGKWVDNDNPSTAAFYEEKAIRDKNWSVSANIAPLSGKVSWADINEYVYNPLLSRGGSLKTFTTRYGLEPSLYDQLFKSNKKQLFSELRSYVTYNILIPVETPVGQENPYPEMKEKFKAIMDIVGKPQLDDHIVGKPQLDDDIQQGIYEGFYDKDYFIREPNGNLYFKFPLITLYGNKDGVDSLNAKLVSGGNTEAQIQELWKEAQAKIKLTPADRYAEYAKRLGETNSFKFFADNLQYRQILSFAAIMVSELTERKYPEICVLFRGTLTTVINALALLLNQANRGENPDFYQADASSGGPPLDFDWGAIILKLLITILANATDPTWKTPWFLPGPLTPFGIIAKMIQVAKDGADFDTPGGTANAMEDANKKIQELVDLDCTGFKGALEKLNLDQLGANDEE
ncbi:MAG: hypothetical protein GOVbin630_85 [Prokaryotic dsDNA virus sp.]|nr:MAG: hypothetical protein GOVbin630_85 [Prokaryotic dsDNA virus sp.]|tara:strand:+ start:2342 stop:9001 length:6660 start_codon:yes stop_codon:yes gene_type:complete